MQPLQCRQCLQFPSKEWPCVFLESPRLHTGPRRGIARPAVCVCVKVCAEPGFGVCSTAVPSAETLAALRAETRRRGRVLIPANAVDSWRAALDAHAGDGHHPHGLWSVARGPPSRRLRLLKLANDSPAAVAAFTCTHFALSSWRPLRFRPVFARGSRFCRMRCLMCSLPT